MEIWRSVIPKTIGEGSHIVHKNRMTAVLIYLRLHDADNAVTSISAPSHKI